ncbi:DUF742 domain-containing protein [Kibdelosporangium phytohabitans]|uniref:Multi-component regulatory system-8 n=1 Tax=Kibdelosporangium phytohabitans TaxID=860235 RepID=A0A0N9HS37_9PSEU|nr:DUF742 domain-containing protein [Kibdelosporangium phytohabitans]ALG06003.1 hypothetical protein AOZ06_02885 [Kibdelosporangium phytohabitans]MBE1465930.1 hypothetical protein [Kibdelosporangium phytohabitans]
MARGHRASGGRFGADFSYQDWASAGFRFDEPDAGGPDDDDDAAPDVAVYHEPDEALDEQDHRLPSRPERRQEEMPERGWEDLPEHGLGDPPNRIDLDGYRARLFGGPGASLYGDPGVPRQNDWNSDQLPAVPAATEWEEPVRAEPIAETGSLVRPYTKTGGRTRSDYDLAIEALVSTSDRGRLPEAAVLPEHRSICGLCLDTRSVAEVAAHLRLPLGVARVLIGDMAGMGLVLIHQSGMVVGDRPSIEFMERVLSGLRRL